MGSLKNIIDVVDFDKNIVINPEVDDIILDKTDYELIKKSQNLERPESGYGYDIKIRLDDYRPLTWRDLIIPSNMTFLELHKIIQIVMGLYDCHLYQFSVKKPDYILFLSEGCDDTMIRTRSNAISRSKELFDVNYLTYDESRFEYLDKMFDHLPHGG